MAAADARNASLLFGGKIVVFSGDFRQVLPVFRRAERARIVSVILKKWPHWHQVSMLTLSENMRARNAAGEQSEEEQQFSDWLLRIGNGVEQTVRHELYDDYIRLPDGMCVNTEDKLIQQTFPAFDTSMYNRAILTLKNIDTEKMNTKILSLYPVDERVYSNADSVEDEAFAVDYPTEFLNDLMPSGLPLHNLRLKIGCPVILLRNMNQPEGLCNGTRLIVRGFHHHLIDAKIVTGSHAGQRVLLPRIKFLSSDTDLLFTLCRRQFPLRLAFCLTINKAQSQTLDFVGVYLPDHVFSLGQLYVALSRVGSADRTRLFIEHGQLKGKKGTYTRNVVFKGVLQ
jgi:hypothetical protein